MVNARAARDAKKAREVGLSTPGASSHAARTSSSIPVPPVAPALARPATAAEKGKGKSKTVAQGRKDPPVVLKSKALHIGGREMTADLVPRPRTTAEDAVGARVEPTRPHPGASAQRGDSTPTTSPPAKRARVEADGVISSGPLSPIQAEGSAGPGSSLLFSDLEGRADSLLHCPKGLFVAEPESTLPGHKHNSLWNLRYGVGPLVDRHFVLPADREELLKTSPSDFAARTMSDLGRSLVMVRCMEAQLGYLEERDRLHVEEIARLRGEKEKLAAEQEKTAAEVVPLKREVASKNKELQAREEQLDKLRAEIRNERDEKESAQTLHRAAQKLIAASEEKIAGQMSTIKGWETQCEGLEKANKRLTERVSELKGQRDRRVQRVRDCKNKIIEQGNAKLQNSFLKGLEAGFKTCFEQIMAVRPDLPREEIQSRIDMFKEVQDGMIVEIPEDRVDDDEDEIRIVVSNDEDRDSDVSKEGSDDPDTEIFDL